MLAKDIFRLIVENLQDISTESDKEAEIIIKHIFDLNKLDIVLNKKVNYSEKSEYLNKVLEKRKQRIPLQYIFNNQDFRSYNFYVDSRVLIPRPETELLVDKVISISNEYFFDKQINIVDIGCGSGTIALSLALEIKNAKVYTVDISNDALDVAKINQKRLNVAYNRINFVLGDKLEPFRDKKVKFDIIVSNPPYIPEIEYQNLEKEVLSYEPKQALLGQDDDGLGFYRYFASQSDYFLNKSGFICLEVGYNQAEKVKELFLNQKKFDNIEMIKDYNGIYRIVIARQKI
ncbi:MAG: peptide chain release factor N(5)-glutamine methyltransferase [Candidatus Sericytochromatia bacterium]|nr:peptide chain release factor N(5)-glutamine methyltransferase [Candidatus Sericytochromatia bacterium]